MTRDPLSKIVWPENPTIETLAGAVADACGVRIQLAHIPEQLRHPTISGLTVLVEEVAHVYFDPSLSPLNRIQTIAHEYAHILNNDLCIDGQLVCHRTVFDDPHEKRAELLAMRLLMEIENHQQMDRSPVLAFLAGRSTSP